jgi:hypothetical protein
MTHLRVENVNPLFPCLRFSVGLDQEAVKGNGGNQLLLSDEFRKALEESLLSELIRMGLGGPIPRVLTIHEIPSICRIAVSSAISSFQTHHEHVSNSEPSPKNDKLTRQAGAADDEDKKPDLNALLLASSGAPQVERRMYPVPADAPTYAELPKPGMQPSVKEKGRHGSRKSKRKNKHKDKGNKSKKPDAASNGVSHNFGKDTPDGDEPVGVSAQKATTQALEEVCHLRSTGGESSKNS